MAKTTVTFGEIMLRLAPPGFEKILQTPQFVATFGGGEANVAVAVAQFGLPAAFVTVLPDKNSVSDAIIGELRRFGVDTSRTMLAKALKNISHHCVTFRAGDAEQLPVTDGSSCLAFLSMVYHHIGNPARAFRELHRALRVGGFVCIRQSTLEHLDMVPYLKYFPAALEYNRACLPSQVEIAATARGAGLSLLRHSVIEQEFASSMREYRDKVKMRALSDLAALSDAEFDAGIRRMEDDTEQEVRSAIFEPIDLFIFQKVTSLEADR